MSDEIKFCKDCKWCDAAKGIQLAKCMHERAQRADPSHEYLVTGEGAQIEQYFCATMRQITDCGPSGKLWESA